MQMWISKPRQWWRILNNHNCYRYIFLIVNSLFSPYNIKIQTSLSRAIHVHYMYTKSDSWFLHPINFIFWCLMFMRVIIFKVPFGYLCDTLVIQCVDYFLIKDLGGCTGPVWTGWMKIGGSQFRNERKLQPFDKNSVSE